MASEYQIETAFNYQLNQFKTAYPIDLAFVNSEYTPILNTDYIKVDFLPSEPTQNGIGTNSQNRFFGIYQLTVNTNINEGKYKTNVIYDALKLFFKRGSVVEYDTIQARITRMYLGSYLEDAPWYRQVINIEFRADIDN